MWVDLSPEKIKELTVEPISQLECLHRPGVEEVVSPCVYAEGTCMKMDAKTGAATKLADDQQEQEVIICSDTAIAGSQFEMSSGKARKKDRELVFENLISCKPWVSVAPGLELGRKQVIDGY